MKFLLVLFFIFPSQVFSQPRKIIHRVSYLNKKICNSDNKHCKKQTSKYVEACSEVGDYYYSIKQYGKAIFYYSKPMDINLDGHGKISWYDDFDLAGKTAYLNVFEKLGKMYYYGLGIKSDTLASLSLLTEIIYAYSKEKRSEFSRMLFDNDDPTFGEKILPVKNGKMEIFINPFYLHDSSLFESLIIIMKNVHDSLTKDPDLICEISITDNNNFTHSEWRINLGYRLLTKLRETDKLLMSQINIVDGECQSCYSEMSGVPVQYLTIELKKRK